MEKLLKMPKRKPYLENLEVCFHEVKSEANDRNPRENQKYFSPFSEIIGHF